MGIHLRKKWDQNNGADDLSKEVVASMAVTGL